MIERESIQIKISGESFSPAEAAQRTGLAFSVAVEPGGFAPRGQFKDKPCPFGYANVEAVDDVPDEVKLEVLIDRVLPHVDALRSVGATQFIVYAGYFFREQCNLTFMPRALRKLVQLDAPFWVSCYGLDDQ